MMKSLKKLLKNKNIRADSFTYRQIVDMPLEELRSLRDSMSTDEFWELGRQWLDIHKKSTSSLGTDSSAQDTVDTLRAHVEPSIDGMRIVEGKELGKLESMDDDCDVMDVSLNLDEACKFDFDKHMDAIVGEQDEADDRLLKEQARERPDVELDRRYKEMPRDRIKY